MQDNPPHAKTIWTTQWIMQELNPTETCCLAFKEPLEKCCYEAPSSEWPCIPNVHISKLLMFGPNTTLTANQCIWRPLGPSSAQNATRGSENCAAGDGGRMLQQKSGLIQHAPFNLVAFSVAKSVATCNHFSAAAAVGSVRPSNLPKWKCQQWLRAKFVSRL